MKVLLDTHILLWALAMPERLSPSARDTIERASALYVSAASIWEISIKAGLGKLDADLDEILAHLHRAGLQALDITWTHARAVQQLPMYHRDPFDRLLIAQAVSEPLHLLTADTALKPYSPLVLCFD
ncbi:type II toxin-antitoxin system VapC family toxin [Plasticicumulans acidivorans]|uniref:PIN domain nuclease of toxin-antitoxin system n=1 Tax=Plasticicumulans acidivorans TaxID=886464 RepID=A0A317MQI9_9GAMM|nr:type II toxin-antitoxin system VapC family toxin [Plasticicumulans acidivorans]PWV58323.1 PIN domain nuclease of toxin-antitoxin system [Plasticicumulans acidivorans]